MVALQRFFCVDRDLNIGSVTNVITGDTTRNYGRMAPMNSEKARMRMKVKGGKPVFPPLDLESDIED